MKKMKAEMDVNFSAEISSNNCYETLILFVDQRYLVSCTDYTDCNVKFSLEENSVIMLGNRIYIL